MPLLLAGLALLSGCKEEKKSAATPAASVLERARDAAEQNMRSGAPPDMKFRGVQVWAQATAGHVAVCGQLDPFADNPDIFVPFVSIVTLPANPDDRAAAYQFEHHIGTNTSEATRVYAALVTYCYDQGGTPTRSDTPAPPLPDAIPDPGRGRLTVQTPPPPPAPGTSTLNVTTRAPTTPPAAVPATDAVPASGSVSMRQAANLHSDPHGPSIRVLAQGTPLHVFGQAPGGWYQVGDTAPWGWVHESMLDKH